MTTTERAFTATSPFVCVFSGVPGTGKSTLAEAITQETHAALINWDWLMSAVRVFPEVWAATNDVRTYLGLADA